VARPELVIFDCDGVLVDSEVISNRVVSFPAYTRKIDHARPQADRDGERSDATP
jgi:beta-phosphoglucomutase-like phosphatase (HAD superfamily)